MTPLLLTYRSQIGPPFGKIGPEPQHSLALCRRIVECARELERDREIAHRLGVLRTESERSPAGIGSLGKPFLLEQYRAEIRVEMRRRGIRRDCRACPLFRLVKLRLVQQRYRQIG